MPLAATLDRVTHRVATAHLRPPVAIADCQKTIMMQTIAVLLAAACAPSAEAPWP